jgi:hypothetical protein
MTAINGTHVSAVDVNEFVRTIEVVSASAFTYDGDRIKALAAAYALVSRLETPWDTVARLCMTEVEEYPFLLKSSYLTHCHCTIAFPGSLFESSSRPSAIREMGEAWRCPAIR